MTVAASADVLAPAALRAFAERWYRALDVHAPLEELLAMLVDDGLEMVFPEGTSRGHAGFTEWYERVTRIFFDEVHTVTRAELVGPADGADDRVVVDVVVNWQARVWQPPEPRSTWLGFDARQTWHVVAGADGAPRIARYVVDGLDPMPGSGSL